MNKHDLALRARKFAVDVYKLTDNFPKTTGTFVVTNQLLRASSSVAANYRAALRTKSRADFLNKLKIVLEEVDESEFWLTFVAETNVLRADNIHLNRLQKEANELISIFAAAVKTISQEKS